MSEAVTPETQLQPDIHDKLRQLSERTAGLEAEVDARRGTDDYPEWWVDSPVTAHGVLSDLAKDETIEPAAISEYYELLERESSAKAAIAGRENTYNALHAVEDRLGSKRVGQAFAAETTDGPLHKSLFNKIAQAANTDEWIDPEIEILQAGYSKATPTELLGVGGDEYSDALRPLLRSPRSMASIRQADIGKPIRDSAEWSEQVAITHDWMSRAVQVTTGIDAAEAKDYTFAAVYGSSRKDPADQDKNIIDILGAFDHFGVERVREITEFSGIHGLDCYSIEQLERMEDLMLHPEAAAAQLAEKDVTVAFINRFGDENGILENVAETYEDEGKRTLCFEITRMSDIYKYGILLDKLGVEPSTVVLAAHSSPGKFVVADERRTGDARWDVATIAGRSIVESENNLDKKPAGRLGHSMHGMKGLTRLVDTMMRPSRAINDAAADKGKKKFIFVACNAGTESEQYDLDENNNEIQTGVQSVIGQLGADLVANGVKSEVDIYGAPSGIQIHRTEKGVRYSKGAGWGEERLPQPALRVRVVDGKLDVEQVDEIELRAAA